MSKEVQTRHDVTVRGRVYEMVTVPANDGVQDFQQTVEIRYCGKLVWKK